MSIEVYVRTVTFSDGTEVEVPRNGALVLVGPNNSGKSAALREIYHHFTGSPRPVDQPYRVVPEMQLEKDGTADDLRDWLEEHSHAFTIRHTGERRYTRPGAQLVWGVAQSEWEISNALGNNSTNVFVLPSYTEQRLTLIGQAAHWNPMEESPSAPLQILFARPELEEQVSAISVEAFDVPLHLSRFPGGPIDLYVGTPTTDPSTTTINEAYINEIRSMPLLREQGDGMRSFVGIMLALVASPFPIVLLDEPEAFLHPPQARLLGRRIAGDSPTTQIIMATHSTDTLVGLLASGAADVTVVRLTRRDDINPVSVLSHERLTELWSDPLLESSNLLDGLFHRGVVLCEGDSDARYYGAVLNDIKGDRAHELFFTHCGGKARMPMVIRALRALDVPVVAIADLDVLREEDRVSAIVQALGEDWSLLRPDWIVVNAAVKDMSAAPEVASAKDVTSAIFDEAASAGPRLSADASAKIRAATKVDDGWSMLKRSGLRALPHGDATAAAERLLARLREVGLFLVDVGELEGWHPGVPKTEWLDAALSDGLYQEPGPHREFMNDLERWFAERA